MRLLLAARLSQFGADGHEGLGLDTQDINSRLWAEREIDPDTGKPHEIVAVAADTQSGTVAPWDRPNLKPWVTDPLKMIEYDGVLAFKNDRLSRGCWDDEVRIRLWAKENGKKLVIVNGPQWPPRHDGDEWMWEAQAKQARKEWEADQERSIRFATEIRSRGFLVGRTPWGYDITGPKYSKTLVPNELGLQYGPLIFERCAKGASCLTIARWLNDEGVPPVMAHCLRSDKDTCRVHRGKPFRKGARECEGEKGWSHQVVRRLIRNSTYKGQRVQAGGMIMSCPPIVDVALWEAANRQLRNRTKRGPGPADSENRAMLATALWCSCGGPMYRLISRGVTPYYRCHGTGPAQKSCGALVRLEALDAAVAQGIHTRFDEQIEIRTIIPGDDHSSELDLIKAQIRALAMQDLSDSDYDRELARLRAERDRVKDLPKTESRVLKTFSDDTYADRWDSMAPAKRGPWLREMGFTVVASKDVVKLYKEGVKAPWVVRLPKSKTAR